MGDIACNSTKDKSTLSLVLWAIPKTVLPAARSDTCCPYVEWLGTILVMV